MLHCVGDASIHEKTYVAYAVRREIRQWAMEQLMVLVVFLIVSKERSWRLLR
ncbi:hypothetical protein C0J52_09125 [Blattella germanica]|nr:hypothetical protein C0J52_09125 [Blattella germanica]